MSYIYRHPGTIASAVVDRHKESICLKVAKELNIDGSFMWIDEEEGWKISKFITATDTFDFSNKRHVEMLAEKLKTLHDSKKSVGFGFNYEEEAEKIIEIERYVDANKYNQILKEKRKMEPLFEHIANDPWQRSLCHNDIYEPNLLVYGDDLSLIDWEFAGDADIGYDVCKLFSVVTPSYEEIDQWVYPYFSRNITEAEKLHLISCACVIYYYWYVWGVFAEKNSEDVSGYLMQWHDKMNYYRNLAMELLEKREENV